MSLSEFLKKDLYSSLSNNIPLKNFLVLKYYKTSKTIIGICLYNNKKRFFKIINDPEDEIRRINCIKSIYRIPKVIDVINNKCIIYEYIKDFKFKTINDYLYNNNNNKEMSSEKFLNQYNISINDTLCLLNETNSQSKKYFQNRVNLLNNYLKKLPYQYGAEFGQSMIVDDIKTIEDAILEATDEMKNQKKKEKQEDENE